VSAKKEAVYVSKPSKWMLQAQAYDAKQAEVKTVASKLFDPVELTRQAKTIHEADEPLLGKLRFGELTLDDSFIIDRCKSDAEKSSMAAYLMLKKAYPEMPVYEPENIKQWAQLMPLAEGAALLQFLSGTPAFLRVQSLRGLAPTKLLKKSLKS
jgi:hypothetical protein